MMKPVMTHTYRFGLIVLLISLFCGMAYAEGVIIPASAVKAPADHNVGNGLHGEFYKSRRRISHINMAEYVVATRNPNGTFMSTWVDYPNGNRDIVPSTSRLSAYLGRDRDTLRGNGRVNLQDAVMRFHGLLMITRDMDDYRESPAIDVWFAVGSDDGCRLRIGGQIVVEWPGTRAFEFVSGVASFLVEGLYEIELICFEHLGHTGIELYSSIPGGPNSGAPHSHPYAGIVPTEVLSKKLGGFGGKIRGLDVTHQQCWNLTTDQIVQVVETHRGHWTCGPDFEWEPGDLVQVITIGPGT